MTREKILNALSEVSDIPQEEIDLEIPGDESHGDYSTNIALKGERDPRQRAEELVKKLSEVDSLKQFVSAIEVAGPGFINFKLSQQALMDNLEQAVSSKDFGKGDLLQGNKIMVEYAHPNTHKELHIGHMRTLTLGESLVRIFEFLGAEVFRANYQGDIGPHVAKSIWGTRKLLSERNLTWDEAENLTHYEKAHLLGEGYALGSTQYEDNQDEINAINSQIYRQDAEIMPIYERTRRWSLEYYDIFYSRFYTSFDRLYFESEVAELGKKTVEENVGKVFEQSEGAIIFPGEKYGLHTRVFVTKDGNPTYEGKEVGLAQIQFRDFQFNKNIHVVASEQAGYFQVVIKAIEQLFPELEGREHHLSMGMVQLVGKKMSSRTGDVLTVNSLIDEVKDEVKKHNNDEEVAEMAALAAIKYAVLKVSPSQNVMFDIKTSVSIEGNSGPYLQYTYARMKSVIEKSETVNSISTPSHHLTEEEVGVMRHLVHFPEVIQTVGKSYTPNILANYLFDLASKFNSFYNANKIIDSDEEEFRLTLTMATANVIRKGLDLLGIAAPEKM